MAVGCRRRRTGVVFHSDRGSQYLSGKFTAAVSSQGMNQSVGRVGSSADNAVVEAFLSSLERELVNRRRSRRRSAGDRAPEARSC